MVGKIPVGLLHQLADGKFHSGEAIGEHLGISRSAIWKQLQKLHELGLETESVKGRGHRLQAPVRLLNEVSLQGKLQSVVKDASLDVLLSTVSTNDVLNARIHEKCSLNSGDTVLSERQTGGRGRRGRAWRSPFGENIYLSMLWVFRQGVQRLDGLSLVVGLAIVEALRESGAEDVLLKWPNDVMVGSKKIGGVLLEVHGDPLADCHVVMGMGINVNMRDGGGEIDQPWTALNRVLGENQDRNRLVGRLLEKVIDAVRLFEEAGFLAFQEKWMAVDWLKNAEVVLALGERRIFGSALGVDALGSLLIEVDGEIKSFSSGEVSVRKNY